MPACSPSAHDPLRPRGRPQRPDRAPVPTHSKLADRFTDPLILEHNGGHVIPGDRTVAEPIARFLARFASTARTGG